jgi:hypothetical protein
MAKLVGVLNTSHTWVGRSPEKWGAVREARDIRDDVPTESFEERVEKAKRVATAVKTLRDKLAELRPDVLVVFGDDQSENFPSPELRVVPQVMVFCGEEFTGIDPPEGGLRQRNGQTDFTRSDPQQPVKGHPALAKAILYGLMDNGFDPAFSLDVPNPEKGIGHAVMNPLGYFTDYEIPAVPIVLNAIYAPCLTGKRANDLGHAIRKIVDEYPEDLRVVALASGGLWHTTSAPQTWLNEEFDKLNMKYLAEGDITGWASNFDSYVSDDDDQSQVVTARDRGSSSLPATPGPQFGTREELDWIASCSMAEGSPFGYVEMFPIYSSPIDFACAYCDDVK